MNENDARAFMECAVSRETFEKLDRYVSLLVCENERQNLISAASVGQVWSRHILDSVQLTEHAPPSGRWLDLGSGPGLPGMVVAILGRHAVTLVEARARRVAFLYEVALKLDIPVSIVAARVERMPAAKFAVISARAFAPLDRLLTLGMRFAGEETIWVLPKGKSGAEELARARKSWHGEFVLRSSRTDPQAHIIVARNVSPKECR